MNLNLQFVRKEECCPKRLSASWQCTSSYSSSDSAITGLGTSTSSSQAGFGAKRLSYLGPLKKALRGRRFTSNQKGKRAHLAWRATEKHLRRNTETSYMILQMHCVASRLCRKMCKIDQLLLLQPLNIFCFYFLILPWIYSKYFESHLEYTRLVLDRLSQVNLMVKREKVLFAMQ